MTIATILSEKGRHVITAPPTMALEDIARELMRHGSGRTHTVQFTLFAKPLFSCLLTPQVWP